MNPSAAMLHSAGKTARCFFMYHHILTYQRFVTCTWKILLIRCLDLYHVCMCMHGYITIGLVAGGKIQIPTKLQPKEGLVTPPQLPTSKTYDFNKLAEKSQADVLREKEQKAAEEAKVSSRSLRKALIHACRKHTYTRENSGDLQRR
jgi:hypothetical protein